MKLRIFVIFSMIFASAGLFPAAAQTESVITQFTSSGSDSYAGSISGDGRFVVFESTANIATVNPRNSDANPEIFLWDFAQRRIFQITDTKPVLKNSFGTNVQNNIKVDVINKRPVISQNGRWIAFASNATTATAGTGPNATNPGSFRGNDFDFDINTPLPCAAPSPSPTPTPTVTPTPSGSPTPTPSPVSTPANNPLQCDGNLEIWLYEVPATAPADLSSGDQAPLTDLSGGAFILVTNSIPSRFPLEGTALRQPFLADDNHDASINDDGRVVAFASTRDLVANGNPFPSEDNDEIFVYVHGIAAAAPTSDLAQTHEPGAKHGGKVAPGSPPASWAASAPSGGGTGVISQVTQTTRGPISNPIYNKNPVISGDGLRVAFASTGDNPIIGMTGGNNPESSRNEEIFVSDLDLTGAPTGLRRQITVTSQTNPGDLVNLWEYGKRMSRNGQYIAFDSFADLASEHSGANQAGFATFVYDVSANTFRRVLARSNADSAATGGDVPRFPSFTDYDVAGAPSTLVLETRMNILANGTVATTAADGLNNDAARPVQIYTLPLTGATPTFNRITKFPISNTFLAQTQPLTSDTSQRLAFNFALTELGGTNTDLLTEVFYLYVPAVTSTATAELSFATGASNLPILPTNSASPTPTPSPSPTATPTPTPTPSPSVSPTPVTPAAVQGASPGMLAFLNSATGFGPAITPRTAAGSLGDSPDLPIELSGVSMTIRGYAVGLRSVDDNRIEFVLPTGFIPPNEGLFLPVVVNNQGNQIKGFITIVPSRPDIFATVVGPGGRASAKNVTNRVHTTEPFMVRTLKVKGGLKVPSLLRLRITGLQNVPASAISIRIGDTNITGTPAPIVTGGVLVEPGVYTVDFQLPEALKGAGDQPIVVTVTAGSVSWSSRLADTAPRISIL